MLDPTVPSFLNSFPENVLSQLAPYWNLLLSPQLGLSNIFQFVESFREELGLPKIILQTSCRNGQLLELFELSGYETFGIENCREMRDTADIYLRVSQLFDFHTFQERTRSFPIIIFPPDLSLFGVDLSILRQLLQTFLPYLMNQGFVVFSFLYDTRTLKYSYSGTSQFFYQTSSSSLRLSHNFSPGIRKSPINSNIQLTLSYKDVHIDLVFPRSYVRPIGSNKEISESLTKIGPDFGLNFKTYKSTFKQYVQFVHIGHKF